MDLSCNETMTNDVENEYNIYMEYPSDEKRSTSASDQNNQLLSIPPSKGIAKLYSNACPDPTFLNDRCLQNLLISQERYKTPSCAYFNTIQKTLTPQMRKIVVEWVIEVSLFSFIDLKMLFLLVNSSKSKGKRFLKNNYTSPACFKTFCFCLSMFCSLP